MDVLSEALVPLLVALVVCVPNGNRAFRVARSMNGIPKLNIGGIDKAVTGGEPSAEPGGRVSVPPSKSPALGRAMLSNCIARFRNCSQMTPRLEQFGVCRRRDQEEQR